MSTLQIIITIIGVFLSIGGSIFSYHKYIIAHIRSENEQQEKEFERELEIAQKEIEKKLDKEIYAERMEWIDKWQKEKDETIKDMLKEVKESIKSLGNKLEKLKECH